MLKIYHPSESELLEEARACLQSRLGQSAGRFTEHCVPASPLNNGAAPACEARRKRSLQTCHRPRLYERPRFDPPPESGAYVPELAARLEDDRNLTDGARRCARKIAELTYRSNRTGRALEVTITYLMQALGRCRRTVQRYLRLLEREGYIRSDVVKGARSRLCTGLLIYLLGPLFSRHHKEKWPGKIGNSGATQESQNQKYIDSIKEKPRLIPRHEWALKCMDGVFRSFMKTLPLFDPIPVPPG